MEWPPEFILARLRQLARDKLQPSELLTILRELALQYKAFLAHNAWRRDDYSSKEGRCADHLR